jgi:hypothetical protein
MGLLGGTLLSGCGAVAVPVRRAADAVLHQGGDGRYGRLTKDEQAWAKTAWRYFENNTNPENGLINSFDGFPTFSMWHVGDYLAALSAAHDFRLIDSTEFDQRVAPILKFLNSMDLFEGQLPNKLYNSVSGKMVNYENQPGELGWSAIEIGRILTWMRIFGTRYPQYREYMDKAALRWNFCSVIEPSRALYGVARGKDGRHRYQEGRLGYEQLAAAGFAAWGFDTSHLWTAPRVERVTILGEPVHYDARDPRTTGTPNAVMTMPHVLLGMEYGWHYPGKAIRHSLRQYAHEVYHVQEVRFTKQGILTARTDYQIREAPYAVTDSVFASGFPWNTLGADGKEYSKLALLSTRAAFGMWALWPTDYTDRLMQNVRTLYTPNRGWFEGRYEQSGAVLDIVSASTNAAVLEALLFKVRGRLYPDAAPASHFGSQVADPFLRSDKCLPQ